MAVTPGPLLLARYALGLQTLSRTRRPRQAPVGNRTRNGNPLDRAQPTLAA